MAICLSLGLSGPVYPVRLGCMSLLGMTMTAAKPLKFLVRETPPTVIDVVGADGTQYELRIAVVVSGIFDHGLVNPLDQLPILNINAQIASQVKKVTSG